MKSLFLIYGVTYGGAVAAIFYPYIGVLLYIGLSVLRPESLWEYSVGVGNNFSQVAAAGLVLGWVVRGFGKWQFGRGTATIVLIVAFYLWSILSAFRAPNEEDAFAFVPEFGKILLPIAVGMTCVDTVAKLRGLVLTIVACMSYVCLELNISYWTQEMNVLAEEGYGWMDNNSMAIAIVTCIGLTYFLVLHEKKWWLRLLAFAAMAFMAHAVIFSLSRGGMLGVLVTLFVAFVFTPKRPVYLLIFALMLAVGARLAISPTVQDRFLSSFNTAEERDESAQSRIDLWKDCLKAIEKRPVLGIGPHCWGLAAEEYGWPKGKEAHSLWLQTAAEVGVPGVSFLLLAYLVTIYRLLPLTFERKPGLITSSLLVLIGITRPLPEPVPDPYIRYLARMCITAMIGFMFSAQFVTLVGLELAYYVVFVGACTLKLNSLAPVLAPAQPERMPPVFAPAAVGPPMMAR